MPDIGASCLELRIPDEDVTWRIICRTDRDAVLIGEVFAKKTGKTPKQVIQRCRKRFRAYDAAAKED
jgi:phage-related protein